MLFGILLLLLRLALPVIVAPIIAEHLSHLLLELGETDRAAEVRRKAASMRPPPQHGPPQQGPPRQGPPPAPRPPR